MPRRNAKGRFIKGGSHSKAVTKYRTRTKHVTKYRTRSAPKRHRRRSHGSAMPRIVPIAATAAVMSYAMSASGPAALKSMVAKIPGASTFGGPAALGIACLAVDKFVKPNKWLKLAGLAGVVLAATKVGEQGTGFKWLGDVGDDYDLADDMSDDDMSDVGDDE